MLAQRRPMAKAGEQRSGDAAGMGVNWRDCACLGNRSRVAWARHVLQCGLAVLLVCLLALPAGAAPASAPAAPGDEYWAAGYNLPGMNDDVYALAFGPDGSLYAGGSFTTAGEVAANYIARWDGSDWHPLGSGMDYYVYALAFGPDGSLYAGCLTACVGGLGNSIARWDGVQWHPLGSGVGGEQPLWINSLAFGSDGSLYAGGHFTTAGGVAANFIARWDSATSSWHSLGSGMNDDVAALAVGPDGSVYAGGWFSAAGGVMTNSIARWDGSRWHPLGSGMDGGVSTLAFGPDGSLYAGGRFTTAGGVAANSIARWDGATSSWHPLGSGMAGYASHVSALAIGPDGSLYAGGHLTIAGSVAATHIARWDGATSSWHPMGSGLSYYVHALASGSDGSLYAGGDFIIVGGVAATHIARWDGAEWRRLSLGGGMRGNSVYASAFGPDGSLYAGGSFITAGEVMTNHIARWDGFLWHTLGSGMNDWVYALAFGPDGSLYAGGHFTTAGGVAANRIARWDGATSSWHPLGSGMAGGGGGHPSCYGPYVTTLAVGPDGLLYAGGCFTAAGGVAANHIARWDGSQWHPLGSGMSWYVEALALGPDGSLYAGGSFRTAGGVAASGIARWDGATSSWHPLGSGLGGSYPFVRALAFGADGSLYAGGLFTAADGVAANFIARWDGSQWHPLDSGMGGGGEYPCRGPYVSALAVEPDGSLYAGGCFTTAGGVAANHIARWDGATSSWRPLGSGMDGRVSSLTIGPDDSLYTGGNFDTAGGKPSSRIARWTGAVARTPVAWFPIALVDP